MKRAAWILLVAMVTGACVGSAPGEDSMGRVRPLGGTVWLMHEGDVDLVSEPADLTSGDEVRTARDGRAEVELATGGTVELAPGAEVRVNGSGPELLAGDALVEASAPTGVAVPFPTAQTAGLGRVAVTAERGVFRLERGVSLRVAVYEGSVRIPGSGFEASVDRLREAVVAAGIVPSNPRPLQVDPTDRWDLRMLGEAIALGDHLARLQQGLARQLPRRGVGDTVRKALPPTLPTGAAMRHLADLSPAAALVAAVVADRAAREQGLAVTESLTGVVEELRLGASWIVVIAQRELAAEGLLAALTRLSDLVLELLAPTRGPRANRPPAQGPGADPGADTSGDTSTSSGGTSGGAGGDAGSSGGGGGGGDGGDGGGGGDEPTEPPPPSCQGILECTLEDLLGDGLGLGLGS
jgi:hypothetical protein